MIIGFERRREVRGVIFCCCGCRLCVYFIDFALYATDDIDMHVPGNDLRKENILDIILTFSTSHNFVEKMQKRTQKMPTAELDVVNLTITSIIYHIPN